MTSRKTSCSELTWQRASQTLTKRERVNEKCETDNGKRAREMTEQKRDIGEKLPVRSTAAGSSTATRGKTQGGKRGNE